jgi:hypothetical protein
MSVRRALAAAAALSAAGVLVVSAEAAPKPSSTSPTVAYHGTLAVASGEQPLTKKVAYSGTPLRFAATKIPRDMAEPTLGVTKKGSVFTVAGAFDARVNTAAKKFPRTVMYLSRDGGRSFNPLKAGVGGNDSNEVTFDPYVYVDPDYGRAFNVDLEMAGSVITYTDDNGESFGTGFATVLGANDHQTLVTGVPPKGNPTLVPTDPGFPKIVYYCVNTIARIACSHSIDGGRTFVEAGTSPSQAVSTSGSNVCGSLHGHIVTDRDGRLFLPRTECGRLALGVSEDGGLTWETRTVSTTMPGDDPDSSVAVDRAGNLYYTWYDATHRLPYLTTSKDHGTTWSKPRMIAPPGVKAGWFPQVDVGDPGKIAIWMMGSTEGEGLNAEKDANDKKRAWNNYAIVSTNALASNPLFVSTQTNPVGDPAHRGECAGRCGHVYDFLDVVVAPNDSGRVWTTAIDTCIGKCARERVNGFQSGLVEDDHGASGARVGYVLRQVSGPALRGSRPITKDTRS